MSTLLRYTIVSDPFPLQASAAAGPANVATVSVMGTNGSATDSVSLKGLSVQFTAGSEAAQLTDSASTISPVPPPGWTLAETNTPPGYVIFVFHPAASPAVLAPGDSLLFTFNALQPNTQTGETLVTITEGSTGNPTNTQSLTKWPNEWGTVSFWVNPVETNAGGSVTLSWNGTSSSATYTIQYYDFASNQEITLPAAGQSPLSNSGSYPPQGQPLLVLQQTTVFTLLVQETIGQQQYTSQVQQTVTVIVPPPAILSFTSNPATINVNNALPSTVTLEWTTQDTDLVQIEGIGNFTGAQALSGSTLIETPAASTKYFITASGNSTTPAVSDYWLLYSGSASFSQDSYEWYPENNTVLEVTMNGNRPALLVTSGSSVGTNFVALSPADNVQYAPLSSPDVSYEDLLMASYGPLTPVQVYNWFNGIQGLAVASGRFLVTGGTWALKFPDGTLAVLSYNGSSYMAENYSHYESGLTLSFHWTSY